MKAYPRQNLEDIELIIHSGCFFCRFLAPTMLAMKCRLAVVIAIETSVVVHSVIFLHD